MKYAPIHNHSEFSALDGLSTCKEIMQRCQCIGCEAVGITDHGTVAGHLEFAKQAAEHGIKPLFGCELYHGIYATKEERIAAGHKKRDSAHLVAVAATDQGLRNLWSLVTESHKNFYHVGRVHWDMLDKYKEGLILTSGCIQGLVSQDILNEGTLDPLNRYLEIFGDNFYIEIHTYPGEEHERLNKELVAVAQERGLPLVYATDAHFASPEQYETHDAYIAMQTGETILMDPDERKMWHPKSLFIQDEEDIRKSLSYLPESAVEEALANSAEVADRCNASLPEIQRQLPIFIPAESPYVDKEGRKLSSAELFIDLIERGIVNRYGEDPSDEVWERAFAEANVFLEGNLEHYFLQAWDFIQFCEDKEIERGPGRGSAAGAIVSYALGITDVDPLEYDLIFERFYNPGRAKGFPDIDCDFPTLDRPRIKGYMEERWGEDKIAQIGTVTRLKPLSAIARIYKVCGISFPEMEALKKIVHTVPDIDILGPDSVGWDRESDPGKTVYVMDHVADEVKEWIKSCRDPEMAKRMVELVRDICSRVSGYGLHPSGVVVSKVPLQDELPQMWNSKQSMMATMFPMSDVDARGFVKDDFLGLANLDILAEWKRLVEPTLGKIDWREIKKEVEATPDHEMWSLFDRGLTLGLFQIEDGYARHLCKELKPRSVEDLGIIVALNRPGPIRSGAPDSFIARKNGEEAVVYDHPILEDILEPTYGWFLYQEQIIRFFGKLGLSESDADAVRKILGKKKPEEMKALYNGTGEWQDKGFKTLAQSAGIDDESAATIWSKIEDFAKYSFNKSHAIAYATLCFRTTYAKWADTPHFAIACIRVATKQKKSKDQIGKYVSEARRMGISVRLPNIDRSQSEIAYVDGEIYYGFSDIKGIGKRTAEKICELRDKYSLQKVEDLYDAIDKEQALWEDRKAKAKEEGKPFKERSAKSAIPQNRLPLLENIGAFEDYTERNISLPKRQEFEKELLGLILTDDTDEILSANYEVVEELDDYEMIEVESHAIVPGVVASVVPKKTKRDGKSMGIVTVEYQGRQIEFVVFPNDWKAYKFLWRERSVGIFYLSKGDRGIVFKEGQRLTQ